MGLYDTMYLVSKDELDSLKNNKNAASAHPSQVDGVGGNVQDSQVNNIEVAHGGSVYVHGKEPETEKSRSVRSDGGEGYSDANVTKGRRQRSDRSPTPHPKDLMYRGDRRKGVETALASHSQKLSNAKYEGDAIKPKQVISAPDLRREAIINSNTKRNVGIASTAKAEEKQKMLDLVNERVKTLSGEGGVASKRGGSAHDARSPRAKERRIVHELNELEEMDTGESSTHKMKGKGKKTMKQSSGTTSNTERVIEQLTAMDVDASDLPPTLPKKKKQLILNAVAAKKREREEEEEGISRGRRKVMTEANKRKLEEAIEGVRKHFKSSPPLYPYESSYGKRQLDSDEDREHYPPSKKERTGISPQWSADSTRKRARESYSDDEGATSAAKRRQLDKWERIEPKKRVKYHVHAGAKRNVYDSSEDEEMLTNIPYKSRGVTYN